MSETSIEDPGSDLIDELDDPDVDLDNLMKNGKMPFVFHDENDYDEDEDKEEDDDAFEEQDLIDAERDYNLT